MAIQRILLGFHATGTDYRTFLGALYATLIHRYPEGAPADLRLCGQPRAGNGRVGRPHAALHLLVSADHGRRRARRSRRAGRAAIRRRPGTRPWLATHPARDSQGGGGGAQFQQALVSGDATAACEATFAALRAGATTRGVAAGMALVAAQRLNAVPEGDRAELVRIGRVLQYVHAVHVALTQVQDAGAFPLVYTAAAAVNALGPARGPAAPSSPVSASLAGGGLIPGTMLRTLEQQLAGGDTASALTTARRYMQMSNSAGRSPASRAVSPRRTTRRPGDDYALTRYATGRRRSRRISRDAAGTGAEWSKRAAQRHDSPGIRVARAACRRGPCERGH